MVCQLNKLTVTDIIGNTAALTAVKFNGADGTVVTLGGNARATNFTFAHDSTVIANGDIEGDVDGSAGARKGTLKFAGDSTVTGIIGNVFGLKAVQLF